MKKKNLIKAFEMKCKDIFSLYNHQLTHERPSANRMTP